MGREATEEKGLGSSVTVKEEGDKIQGKSCPSFPPAMQESFQVHEGAVCSCIRCSGPEMLMTAQAGLGDTG